MLPFDLDVTAVAFAVGPVNLTEPDLAPIVLDFDPSVEKLSFTLNAGEDGTLFLHNLLDGRGVQVEVGGRVLVTLMDCVANDIPDGCLTFDIKA